MSNFKRRNRNRVTVRVSSGITLGAFLATILSWDVNHSIPWAIFHFFCSWWYVLYYVLCK